MITHREGEPEVEVEERGSAIQRVAVHRREAPLPALPKDDPVVLAVMSAYADYDAAVESQNEARIKAAEIVLRKARADEVVARQALMERRATEARQRAARETERRKADLHAAATAESAYRLREANAVVLHFDAGLTLEFFPAAPMDQARRTWVLRDVNSALWVLARECDLRAQNSRLLAVGKQPAAPARTAEQLQTELLDILRRSVNSGALKITRAQ